MIEIGGQVYTRQMFRQECKKWPGGLYFFTKVVMMRPKLNESLHLPFANFIQLHSWNGGPRLSNRKIAYMPREHFKSTIVSESFPLWLLSCVDRNMTIAIVSAVQNNPEKWLRKIRTTIESNDLFRWAFPEIRPGEKWDATELVVTRDKGMGSEVQASVTGYSLKSGLASQHHDYIICDDLINEQTAQSAVEMAKAVELYHSLEEILKGWHDSRGFLVMGTPWGREDVIHEALKEAAQGTRYKWGIGTGCQEVGLMPHFTISEELKEKYPNELIPTVDLSKPILASECGVEKLIHIRNQSVDKLYLNYGCKPFDAGRNGFNLQLIRDFAEFPDGELRCECHSKHKHHLKDGTVAVSSDPAYIKGKENCDTSILMAAAFACGCKFLMDEWHESIHVSNYLDIACFKANKEKSYLRIWGVEAEALQVTLKEWLIERQKFGQFPLSIRIHPLEAKQRSKDSRIAGAQEPVNNGQWHKRPGMTSKPGENTLGQLFQWPYSHKRDCADAFAYFQDIWKVFPPKGLVSTVSNALGQSNRRREEEDMRLYEEDARII
jgi:hypothetical protein